MGSTTPESAGSHESQRRFEHVRCPIVRNIIPDCRGRFREIFGIPEAVEHQPHTAHALQSAADRIEAALRTSEGMQPAVVDAARALLSPVVANAAVRDEVITILFDSLEERIAQERRRATEQERLTQETDAWLATIPVASLPVARSTLTAPLRLQGWRHPLAALHATWRNIAERWASGNVLCTLDVGGEARHFVRALPLPTQSAGAGSTVDMQENFWYRRFDALRHALASQGKTLTAITSEMMGGTVPRVGYQRGELHMLDHHRIMAAIALGLPIEVTMQENCEGVGG